MFAVFVNDETGATPQAEQAGPFRRRRHLKETIVDPSDFDELTRSLTEPRSRRGALTALLGGTLGLLGLAGAAAKKNGKGKGKKKKKKKGGGNQNQSPAAATCSDGVKNGNESDVDCGGSCPRCANGQGCSTRNDCAGALCPSGTCLVCAVKADCGSDAGGDCLCQPPALGGSMVCTSQRYTNISGGVSSCAVCPPGTMCVNADPGKFDCFKPCGAA
jgi:hypothetical protein